MGNHSVDNERKHYLPESAVSCWAVRTIRDEQIAVSSRHLFAVNTYTKGENRTLWSSPPTSFCARNEDSFCETAFRTYKPAAGGATSRKHPISFCQAFFLSLANPIPARPMPKSASVPGSGTAVAVPIWISVSPVAPGPDQANDLMYSPPVA